MATLVGADGVQEFPLAVVASGRRARRSSPGGEAMRATIDAAPVEFPLVTLAQHAGDSTCSATRGRGARRRLLVEHVPASDDLDTVILRPRLGADHGPDATVAGDVDAPSRVPLRGTRVPHFVAVHAVEGLEPGLYRWPDLDDRCAGFLRRGALAAVLRSQDLGRDAAFVVIGASTSTPLDDRGYREAQLEAGIVEGRLHLAAYALGTGAGMTFLDSGDPGDARRAARGAAVHVCRRARVPNRPGGLPGAPVEIIYPAGPDLRRVTGARTGH